MTTMTPIDIKQLRIGSHVSIGGKRARVVGIRTTSSMSGLPIVQYTTDGVVRFGEIPSESTDINPIEITPALLEELGFELRNSQWRKRLYDDGDYLFLDDLGDCWEVYVCPLKSYLRPQLYAQYLHELEGPLAYYGVELIPG